MFIHFGFAQITVKSNHFDRWFSREPSDRRPIVFPWFPHDCARHILQCHSDQ